MNFSIIYKVSPTLLIILTTLYRRCVINVDYSDDLGSKKHIITPITPKTPFQFKNKKEKCLHNRCVEILDIQNKWPSLNIANFLIKYCIYNQSLSFGLSKSPNFKLITFKVRSCHYL